MSAILGVFSTGATSTADGTTRDVAARMLTRMAARGNARQSVWSERGVALGAARHDWEFGPGFSGPVLVVQDGDCAVTADATLYYRDDLRRKLTARGLRPRGQTASHLILAAYRAWGERCAEELEGDFAFVIHDRVHRRTVAARDLAGKRPLFYTTLPRGGIALASTIQGVLAHPGCAQDLDLRVLAELVAGYVATDGATCHRAVARLEPGCTLVCDQQGIARIHAHWRPPQSGSASRTSLEDTVAELHRLIQQAVVERVSRASAASVWMTGGWESSAVFVSGSRAEGGAEGMDLHLRPLSVSYPPGDPGRMDEQVEAIGGFFKRKVEWVRAHDVPLLERLAARALERDEPLALPYEMIDRMLARESVRTGARVALDGMGGAQLFTVTPMRLSDLLRGGNLRKMAHAGIVGALWDALVHRAHREHRPRDKAPRRIPVWISEGFARANEMPVVNLSGTETRWYVTDQFFPAASGLAATVALEEGVELRSPLCDARLIRCMAARPRTELWDEVELRRMLRRVVAGAVPSDIWERRQRRVGVTAGYFARALRLAYMEAPAETQRTPVLSELGIVDRAALERAWTRFMKAESPELGLRLFLTMQAERWAGWRVGATTDAPKEGAPAFAAARMA
jgi:asparagine synthetase B (glutamine-hydrolysing)